MLMHAQLNTFTNTENEMRYLAVCAVCGLGPDPHAYIHAMVDVRRHITHVMDAWPLLKAGELCSLVCAPPSARVHQW